MRKRQEDRVVITHAQAPDPDVRRVKAALDLWASSVAEQLLTGKAPGTRTAPRTPLPPARAGDQP